MPYLADAQQSTKMIAETESKAKRVKERDR
jgi:hypothetical protein